MKKIILCLCLTAITGVSIKAQVKIGDNPNTINASSLFEMESGTKGFLPPRISLASLTDVTTIPTPATSLLIYNTNAALSPGLGYYYNSGTTTSAQWVKLVSTNDSVVKTVTPSGDVIALTKFPMGELSMLGNTTTTNIPAANSWVKVAGTSSFSSSVAYLFSNGGVNNRLKYTGLKPKMCHIGCTISVKSTSTGSNLKAVLYKNGVALTTGLVQAKMGSSSDIVSTAIHVMTDLSTNDYLELWITNSVSSSDFTVTEMNLFAIGFTMGMD
ncbi:MAG: hypothetical protein Q8M29_05095 [Bacteroidota bacterium]|nr:hypothetical protein [Bacteroidota bacterium]